MAFWNCDPFRAKRAANMIGVIASAREHAAVREFFELFKTPWEFYQSDRRYQVLLCTECGDFPVSAAKLVLIYSGREISFDAKEKIEVASHRSTGMLSREGVRIPLYGDCLTFQEPGEGLLVEEESNRAAIQRYQSRGGAVVRVGYDLFGEVGTLLTVGQPLAYAGIPTLDLHIALLRDLIVGSGVSLVEVPPIPDGYRFIACLTHDVDHPKITRHKWDHTMYGFLYRAVFGSIGSLARGKIPVRNLFTNWAAALKLPFVFLGFAKDFWSGFEDRYRALEDGLPSTYFVIPFKNRPGKRREDLLPGFRAAGYGARDIEDTIGKIIAAGCEVGLHGIDAWQDSALGRAELDEICRLTGSANVGVRMHWLYYDERSPEVLEQAGAAYDSTIGYRETVGYRAGTTQVYKPLQAARLLELPMHVMDTALFYPAYLGLSASEATPILRRLVDEVVDLGGCITVNWHDRSLAPERLWDACYRDLIQDLRNRGAWFATAGQAASWFRKRRSVVFEASGVEEDGERVNASAYRSEHRLPGLRLRTHKGLAPNDSSGQSSEGYADANLNECADAATCLLPANE